MTVGIEYPYATDMFVDRSRVFINALDEVPTGQLSIVIHGTGSPVNADGSIVSAINVAKFFATDPNEASTHFIVGTDGTVVQCVSLHDGAGGNCCVEAAYDSYWQSFVTKYKNLNLCTISIEHCNNAANTASPTLAQFNASSRLVNWLCNKYLIPPYRIKTHASIAPPSRAHCPGNLPMTALQNSVANYQYQSALDSWNSFRTDCVFTSGIAQAWRDRLYSQEFMGPPITKEYKSVDWAGNEIVVQEFAHARCEWIAGKATFRGPTGVI